MDELTAAAAGTTLRRLATELRHYVESVNSNVEASAAVAMAPTGAPGTDLEVVRQVLGDTTLTPDSTTEPLPCPVAVPTAQPGVVIDLLRREVRMDGEILDVTDREYALLRYLMAHRGRAVGREELLDRVWERTGQGPGERTIDVHIRRLRSKLGRYASVIRTVRRHGYCLGDAPEIRTWPAADEPQ